MLWSIPEHDKHLSINMDVKSPRTKSGCSLNNVGKGVIRYDSRTKNSFAGHEVVKTWLGGESSSKRSSNGKQLRSTNFIGLKMKSLQPEKEKYLDPEKKKNLDGLGYGDSLRRTYGPYYWALCYPQSVVLSQGSFLVDGTFKKKRI